MSLYRWRRVRRSLVAITPLAIGLLVAVPFTPEAAAGAGPEFDAPSGLAYGGGHLWVANRRTTRSPRSILPREHGSRRSGSPPTALTSRQRSSMWCRPVRSQRRRQRHRAPGPERVPRRARVRFRFRFRQSSSGRCHRHPALCTQCRSADGLTGRAGFGHHHRRRFPQPSRHHRGAGILLDDPTALTSWQHDLFVTDEAANAVTEIDTTTNSLIKVITDPGLSEPDGIAAAQGHAWVADSASSATTEIDVATATVLGTFGNADGDYGFSAPSVTIANTSNVFIASPFGTSPMVTRLSAATGAPKWYMCNTNGPYYFSELSAFAFVGDHLWVASRSGVNNPLPDAATGSLTELYATSGALITTLPTT